MEYSVIEATRHTSHHATPYPYPIPKCLPFVFILYTPADLEAHGGLYTLHSHLNHSCSPSLSIRHLDPRTALSRITVIAKRSIEPGEELTVTYVDPNLGLKRRREELGGWGFGVCMCGRCVEEEREREERRARGEEVDEEGEGVEDLERELKAGLGVM